MKPKKEECNAVHIVDLDTNMVKLSNGLYEIDGIKLNIGYGDTPIEVRDLTSIKKITNINKLVCYKNNIDDEKFTTDEYKTLYKKLTINLSEDEDGDDYWPDGKEDEEVAYNRFAKKWSPVYESEKVSTPVELVTEQIKYNTGNKYISGMFFKSQGINTLYSYNRLGAVSSMIRDKFTSLGVVFDNDCSYSGTNHKKVWGVSTHSGIRYTVAFNTYIFGDNDGRVEGVYRGTLDDMFKKYDADKKYYETLIQRGYNTHFGSVELSELNIADIIYKLKRAESDIRKFSIKVKSIGKQDALKNITSVINTISDNMKEKE